MMSDPAPWQRICRLMLKDGLGNSLRKIKKVQTMKEEIIKAITELLKESEDIELIHLIYVILQKSR